MGEIQKSRIQEIITLHEEIGGYLKMTLDKAIRIGELLTEQKEEIEHGEWLPWVEENLPFTDRHARNYMSLAKHRTAIEVKTETISDFNRISDALAIARSADSYESDAAFLVAEEWEEWYHAPTGQRILKTPDGREYKIDTGRKRDRLEDRDEGNPPPDWSDMEEQYYTLVYVPRVEKRKSEKAKARAALRRERRRTQKLEKDGAFDLRAEERKRFSDPEDERLFQKWKRDKKREEKWRRWEESFGTAFLGDEMKLDDPQADANQQSVFSALDDYFVKFTDPNRKLEALTNVIKHLRKIGAGLHQQIAIMK